MGDLRYITTDEFLTGQMGLKVRVGEGECFPTIEHLENFLQAIEEMIDNYCHRKFNKDTYTAYFWGNDSYYFYPANHPLDSITSLQYRYKGIDFTDVDTDDYFLTKYSIQNLGTFTSQYYYKLVYVGAYETIPWVIKQAIIEQASLTLQEHRRGVLESESYQNSKMVYVPTPLPLFPQIEQKVRAYRLNNSFR